MDTTNWYINSNVTIILNAQLAASSVSCKRSQLLDRPCSASPWNPLVSWRAGGWWNSSACGATAVTDSWTNNRKLKDAGEKIFFFKYLCLKLLYHIDQDCFVLSDISEAIAEEETTWKEKQSSLLACIWYFLSIFGAWNVYWYVD